MKKFFKILGKSILWIILGILVILGILLIIICNDCLKFCFNDDGKKYCYDVKLNIIERVYYYDGNNKNIFVRENDLTDFNEDETVYYGDGNILLKSKYDKNGKDNTESMYYKNGQIMMNSNSKNGNKDGKTTTYYKNGNILLEGNYENGEKIGIWTGYSEDGDIEKVFNYDNLDINNKREIDFYMEEKNNSIKNLLNNEIYFE